MCMIIKRDGREVPFNREKISIAIMKSIENSNVSLSAQNAKALSDQIANSINAQVEKLSVEDIQDKVVELLQITGHKDIAFNYNEYRKKRTIKREQNSSLMVEIGKKLTASDVQKQNANVDEYSFGGRKGEADSTLMKYYALNWVMSEKSRLNHINNRIYIHDLDSYVVGMHNCFQRNTAFITDRGIYSFENFNDGDSVNVLDMNGVWRNATVRYYGRKPMQHVTFERCGIIKEVNCTSDHRWILKDGNITTDLKIGDSLYPLFDSTNYTVESQRDAEMFCLGFILGDGTDHLRNNKSNLYLDIRLCGEKVKYAPIFESAYYQRHNMSNIGNDLYYVKPVIIGKQSFLTNKMWNLLSTRDKISLFNGYLSADGTYTSTTKVWTSDERILEMIQDISCIAGYHIFNIKEVRNSTEFKKDRLLYDITLTKSNSINNLWKVVDIKPQPNKDYEAWCIEEPVTHSFTLEGGMVTGNCLTVPFDKILSKGFNTRQTDVRPANSINTAFQLVAVIFQLQSLQQFGGVSASHLDWTMVPYVRKSFLKHYIAAYIKDSNEFLDLNLMEILFDTYEDEAGVVRNKFDDWIDDHKKDFFDKTGLKEEDFKFSNKDNLDSKYYQQALYDTVIETQQAAEGMYHNLNI